MLKSRDFMELEKLIDKALMAARNCGIVQEQNCSEEFWGKTLSECMEAERAVWHKLYAMRGENALAACAVDPRNP